MKFNYLLYMITIPVLILLSCKEGENIHMTNDNEEYSASKELSVAESELVDIAVLDYQRNNIMENRRAVFDSNSICILYPITKRC